jgi:hypothetical protein
MEELWLKLRDSLESIAHGENVPVDPLVVNHFCGAYQAHMAIEDANLIPLAVMLLANDAVADLGNAMAKRRGLKP